MTGHAERALTFGQRLTRKLSDRRSKAYIGTNHAVVQNLIQRGRPPEQVILAPQPLDVARLQDAAARLRPQASAHPPTAIYAGYLNERKGVRHLIGAFPAVIEQVPDAQLILVGSGPLEAEIRAQIRAAGMEGHVTLTGFVDPQELPRYYARAEVFVLPTLEDVFGVVITEAIASQLGLVCSLYAGVASHLTDEQDAFIIDPEHHAGLAARLVTLLADAPLRNKFVKNSQAVLAQFSPPHVAAQFEKAVEFALQND
jgi:glycosyltransferase involved in cell wall biosynthesis